MSGRFGYHFRTELHFADAVGAEGFSRIGNTCEDGRGGMQERQKTKSLVWEHGDKGSRET